MANTLFPKGKQKFLTAAINLSSDTIKAILVTSAYTYSTSHEFLSDLGATTVGTAQTLTSKTVTDGVFDADDVTFASLAPGSTLKAIVLFKDTGVAGTSALIDYIDVVTGLPMNTNGGDVTIQWENSGFRIFSL